MSIFEIAKSAKKHIGFLGIYFTMTKMDEITVKSDDLIKNVALMMKKLF